jgi:hypothetical protein
MTRNRSQLKEWALIVFRAGLLLSMLTAARAMAADPLYAYAGANPLTAQTCRLECSRNLALCERARDRGTRCSREFQFCKDGCDQPPREQLAYAAKRQSICAQRCELSASVCSQENPGRTEQCRRGAAACAERCS